MSGHTPPRSAVEILNNPETPAWIREGFAEIMHRNPGYAAFLVAMHDHRVGAQTPPGPIDKLVR